MLLFDKIIKLDFSQFIRDYYCKSNDILKAYCQLENEIFFNGSEVLNIELVSIDKIDFLINSISDDVKIRFLLTYLKQIYNQKFNLKSQHKELNKLSELMNFENEFNQYIFDIYSENVRKTVYDAMYKKVLFLLKYELYLYLCLE